MKNIRHRLGTLFSRTSSVDTILRRIMTIEGQISQAEAHQLFLLAQQTEADQVIVEIGSYQGRSTIALAYGSQHGKGSRVYAVDPHEHYEGVFGGHFSPKDQKLFYQNIIKHHVGEIVSVVSLSSLTAAQSWREHNIKILFLDGEHSYQAVRADYEAWRSFVVPEGIIAFHDCDMDNVKRFIHELIIKKELVQLGMVDSLCWFQRRVY